jgi:hypothetical protein
LRHPRAFFGRSTMHNNAYYWSRPAGNAGICILLHIITMTKQHTNASLCPAPQGDGAPEVTSEMIEAGAAALLRHGIGGDAPTSLLHQAVWEAFDEMQIVSSRSR